jgi:hypothetical protein
MRIGPYKAEGPCIKRQPKRWRCSLCPDMAVLKVTKSEAIAWFKKQMGVNKLPPEAKIESY